MIRAAGNLKPKESVDYFTGSWRKQIPVVKDKKEVEKKPEVALFCPEAAIVFKDGRFSHIDYRYCKGCGICARIVEKGIEMRKV